MAAREGLGRGRTLPALSAGPSLIPPRSSAFPLPEERWVTSCLQINLKDPLPHPELPVPSPPLRETLRPAPAAAAAASAALPGELSQPAHPARRRR